MGNAPLTVAGWALGRTIARLRREAGVQSAAVANTLRVSQPTVSRIENGRHRLTPNQMRALVRLFRVAPEDADRLEAARQDASQPDWRQEYASILDGPLGDVLGLEGGAGRIRSYSGSFVPGALQTRAYADAVVRGGPYARESEVTRRVEVRMRRQEPIWSGRQQLVALVNWSVIEQQVGGADVMREQIEQLLAAIERDNIIFRVIPRSAGAHAGYGADCRILDFPEEIDLPTVVWVETLVSSVIYEQPEKVEDYVASFNMMWPHVLTKSKTISYLKSAAKSTHKS